MFDDRYDGIVGFFGIVQTLTGRKKLQKAIYLAKEHGFPGLRSRFEFHWYGPYSEMLANEVQELVQLGVLSEEQVPMGYPTYRYALDSSASDLFQAQINGACKHRDLVQKIMERPARFWELAATLHYFVRDGYSQEEAAMEVQRVKADKNYTEDQIQSAWTFLQELQIEAERVG